MTKTDIKKRAMISALESTLGIVSIACKKADVARSQHYVWMDTDENYNKSVEDIKNISIDFAESKLYERIKEGDTTAIIFFLKCKGKQRGYVESQKLDLTTNGRDISQEPITVEIIDRREQVDDSNL